MSSTTTITLLVLLLLLTVHGWTTERQRQSGKNRRFAMHSSSFQEEQSRGHVERPTETWTQVIGPQVSPSKPKIIVLGASGKIGRIVVRQLLESKLDANIVAFVRNYDKACRVLYDDILVARRGNAKGPKLQIVQGDLVPSNELPGYAEPEEEAEWLETAQSAAKFYGTEVEDYDNRQENQPMDPNEALEQAIKGCTTIISCVGSVRPTNIWTDFIARPFWRILRRDVSNWCKDDRHPFYVHYMSTRKALAYAEKEQIRRQATADQDSNNYVPPIRFVRISDLCVAQHPWNFVPVLTNILHSMVFRYQEMAERLLEESHLIETVIIRPGDLVDDERDTKTTSLQVDPSGKVPSPSRVGRDDVAALAVSAALFRDEPKKHKHFSDEAQHQMPPFHYKLAVRWASSDLSPYPAQGKMSDGLPDAHQAMQAAVRKIRVDAKTERRLSERQDPTKYPDSIVRFARRISTPRKGLKPYGVFAAIPVYIFLSLTVRFFFVSLLPFLPGRQGIVTALARAGNVLGVTAGLILGKLAFWATNLSPLLQRISRQASPKYFSF